MKKVLFLFSLLLSNIMFGMRQLVIKPTVPQLASVAAMPVIKQAVRNYSGNASAYDAMKFYNYKDFCPFEVKKDIEVIDCFAQKDEKFVHQFIKDNYRYLATAAPVSDAVKKLHYKMLQDSCAYNNTKVCRINGDTVGYVTYLANRNLFGNVRKGLIAQLGVDQSVRGAGIGKKLMLAAEQDLMNQHPLLTKVELMITDKLLEPFYESIGYQSTGSLEGVSATTFMMAKKVRDIPISARIRSVVQVF